MLGTGTSLTQAGNKVLNRERYSQFGVFVAILIFVVLFALRMIGLRKQSKVFGRGTQPMLFAHGFGCDQNMWRHVAPRFADAFRVVLFDHVGAGCGVASLFRTRRHGDAETRGASPRRPSPSRGWADSRRRTAYVRAKRTLLSRPG